MKKLISLLFMIAPFLLLAQNVGINTDGSQPDPTAILDIKSNSKGLLIPRLSTIERTSIPGPVIGLTVFDTDTYSFWIYRGDVNGGWAQLLHSFDKHWDRTGTNIFTTNPGNVGIGINNPAEKLALNGPNVVMQFLNSGSAKGFLMVDANNMRLGTYFNNTTGNLAFATRATDRMWIDETGKVGIGTATPASLLTINGENPYIEMQHNNVNTGFLLAQGDHLKLGTNSTNTTGHLIFQTKLVDRMRIDENGRVGIGTATPSSALTINGTDPTLQLRNGDDDKGFVQLWGNHLRLGTNLANTFASTIIRTKGQDRFYINHEGQMGLNIVPDEFTGTFAIAEDENGTSAMEIHHGGSQKVRLGYSGNSAYLSNSLGNFHIYRNSSWPFIIYADGSFSMGGISKANGYRLSVYGKVIATEFTTQAITDWPDYVFADEYKLKPLAEVRKFIRENKHLPGIPSAVQIEKEGIQLGDMSKRLMEKVEELTLYVLQLQEQVDELKKQIPVKNEN